MKSVRDWFKKKPVKKKKPITVKEAKKDIKNYRSKQKEMLDQL